MSAPSESRPFRAVIGLEIHAQLETRTKMFCGCRVEFGAPPNTHVCPVCLGLPGALPVTNARAVELAVAAALALNASVQRESEFARKHYFYPDLPKGYQITQYDRPLAVGGRLELPGDPAGPARIRLQRLHLEEDAGKLVHDRFPGETAIDLNRAGTPLIEVVTEPDLSSPRQARGLVAWLKRTLEYLRISDCNMEEGNLRVDANVSVVGPRDSGSGVRTELKNLNSFSQLERALTFEIDRHIRLLEAGKRPEPWTLTWDEARQEARPLRSKEAEHDYRYFPEPDLPVLTIPEDETRRIAAELPELPGDRMNRFRAEYGLHGSEAEVLTRSRGLADYYEEVAAVSGDPAAAARWILGELLALSNERNRPPEELGVPVGALADLIRRIRSGELSNELAKRVLRAAADTGQSPARIVEREGLRKVSDTARIATWVEQVLGEQRAEVERYRAGESKLLEFFVGRVMRASGGRADPHAVRRALADALSEGLEKPEPPGNG